MLNAVLFDNTTVSFTYEGDECMGYYLQTHIDVQVKNVEKLFGKYVASSRVSTKSEKNYGEKPNPVGRSGGALSDLRSFVFVVL